MELGINVAKRRKVDWLKESALRVIGEQNGEKNT